MSFVTRAIACLVAAIVAAGVVGGGVQRAAASPWAETGDRLLRSDIEVLANFGLIDNVLGTWPLPWAQISYRLGGVSNGALPPYAQRSLERVRARAAFETQMGRLRPGLTVRATSQPLLVRDFELTARQRFEAGVSAEYMADSTAARLNIGFLSSITGTDSEDMYYAGQDQAVLAFDGTYLAQRVDNWLLYGGYIDQWWGPGQITSIILSNNARPFPRVGLMRQNPKAFENPWLSWIGPWQVNAFVGVLDDERDPSNPLILGTRISVNPIPWIVPGLELGFSRTIMICGSGRPCNLSTFGNALIGNDNVESSDPNKQNEPGNQLAGVDARFSNRIGTVPFELYAQLIGEDEAETSLGLPNIAKVAGLFGGSVWGGLNQEGAMWRVNVEYSNTVADFFSDPVYRVFYNSGVYPDGDRYDKRALGASLDYDGEIFSIAGSIVDSRNWAYRLAFYHTRVNIDNDPKNLVSSSAEDINIVSFGLQIPWRSNLIGIDLSAQDDQVDTPDSQDPTAAIGASIQMKF